MLSDRMYSRMVSIPANWHGTAFQGKDTRLPMLFVTCQYNQYSLNLNGLVIENNSDWCLFVHVKIIGIDFTWVNDQIESFIQVQT